ncbi:10770_t:CDS:1, partial [Cetraspora pellucida]
MHLSGVKSVLIDESKEKEESVIKKLKKNLNDEALINNQKNHINNIL